MMMPVKVKLKTATTMLRQAHGLWSSQEKNPSLRKLSLNRSVRMMSSPNLNPRRSINPIIRSRKLGQIIPSRAEAPYSPNTGSIPILLRGIF
jgi:hypothetical protein